MPFRIHAIVFQKTSDGSIILIVGGLKQEPTLLADMLTAIKNLSEEILSELARGMRIEMTFHHFGGYFVLFLFKEHFFSSIFTEPIPLERIEELGDLFRFTSDVADLFELVVWTNLNDEQKSLGLVPEALVIDFERKLSELVASHKWCKKINFSPLYIKSSSGVNLLRALYLRLISRLEKSIGPNLTMRLILKLAKEIKNSFYPGEIRLIKNRFIRPILVFPHEGNIEKANEYLSLVYLNSIKRIKEYLLRTALDDLDVLSIE